MGCVIRDRNIAFVSTFTVVWTQAFNLIQMGVTSQNNINLIGSHCGLVMGEDRLSRDDLTMFQSIPNCTIFYPSDAISTEHAVYLSAKTKGMCFIRTSELETAVVYSPQEKFEMGRPK